MVWTRGRRALVIALLLLAGLLPLLRANESRHQAAWENGCLSAGGSVWATPAPADNPTVVQLRRPSYECRSAAGVLVSTRD